MANQQNQQPQEQGRRPVTDELRRQRHESRAGSTYKAFLKDVCAIGDFDDEALAERAAISVLCYLEQRVMGEEAKDLNAQIPSKLRELVQRCEIHEGKPRDKYGREAFFQMVAGDLKKDPSEIEPIIRAVVTAVRAQVSEGEAEDFGNMLPPDLRDLWNRPS
jgi:uncharacterized protein (DUF2267 family)